MSETCKTCPYWEELTRTKFSETGVAVGKELRGDGYCHHASCQFENEPMRSATWWCSEHPFRQHDRLAMVFLQGHLASGVVAGESMASTVKTAYALADCAISEAVERHLARVRRDELVRSAE